MESRKLFFRGSSDIPKKRDANSLNDMKSWILLPISATMDFYKVSMYI